MLQTGARRLMKNSTEVKNCTEVKNSIKKCIKIKKESNMKTTIQILMHTQILLFLMHDLGGLVWCVALGASAKQTSFLLYIV